MRVHAACGSLHIARTALLARGSPNKHTALLGLHVLERT